MTDIRFIEIQGDLLDAAIAAAATRRRRPTWKRWGRRPRTAFAGLALALVIAGCAVAAAAGLLGSSERLVVGKVDCYYGTGIVDSHAVLGDTDGLVTGAPLAGQETPATFCRQEINQYPSAALRRLGFQPVKDPELVTCQKNATTAAVFIASGAADQCRRLGLRPLPDDFAAASASVRALNAALQKLYVSRDCWQPSAFVRVARAALARYGFRGWRVIPPRQPRIPNDSPIGLAQCASFATGMSYQSLDGVNRTLDLGLGIPRSVNTVINRVDTTLGSDLAHHCYSRARVRALVDGAFASSGMAVKLAITTNPNGGKGFSYGSRAANAHYAADCPVLFESWPTLNDRTVLVWLNARDGRYLRPYSGPPLLADFR